MSRIFVSFTSETIAENFLEISSEQRLEILLRLQETPSNISSMAKHLQATQPEIHRNFNRLSKVGMIKKTSDGNYKLTVYGTAICSQLSFFNFFLENRKFFSEHNLEGLPQKFLHRMGELKSSKQISGHVKVLEQWQKIYKDAKKYIYNVLAEVPYSSDMIDPLLEGLNSKLKIRTIFSESAVIPEKREKMSKEFKKFIQNDQLQRRMINDVKIMIILNEKSSAIVFPNSQGEADLSKMIISSNSDFHEWCKDYFEYCWSNSKSFQESKLSND